MRQRLKAFTGSAPFVFNRVISTNTAGLSLFSAAVAAGWDQVSPIAATVTINAGAVLYGADTAGSYALDCNGSYPPGSSLRLVNNGTLIGSGGASNSAPGRDGFRTNFPISILNNGVIAGGGGAGGIGQGILIDSPNGQYGSSGGSGGAGAGYAGVVPGNNGAAGVRNGDATYYAQGGIGGKGGWPGKIGATGGPATGVGTVNTLYPAAAGGAPGRAIVGAEYISWENLGTVAGQMVSSVNNFIPTPNPTPSSVGAAFEGGYYAGSLIERVVATLATFTAPSGENVALSPGEYAVIKIPEMLAAPKFYGGQTIQIRKTDALSTRLSVLISSAVGDVLCITPVTSNLVVDGSYHVMGTYRIIFAPKATGESQMAFSSGMATVPGGAATLAESGDNTSALTSVAGAVAAQFCEGLSIGGFTDWKLPSRDNLELGYRNLKPLTINNYTTANRPVSGIIYANSGSAGDTSASQGVNPTLNPASPATTGYTSGTPSQTVATIFRTGGAEAFEFGSATYLSSTKFSDTEVWAQRWVTAEPGRQVAVSKDTVAYVRAVRRSII